MKQFIVENMNESGGGLAINITGLYESNRNALAKLDTSKRTAGEIAKSLRKKGYSIKAKDVKAFCEEWHHAGKFNNGMTKVYYSQKTDDAIIKEMDAKLEEIKKQKEQIIFAFYYVWIQNGRKKAKQLMAYKGSLYNAPHNFTTCNEDIYNKALANEGKLYIGWDEPTEENINLLDSLEEKKRKERNRKRRLAYAEKKQEAINSKLLQEKTNEVQKEVNDILLKKEQSDVDVSAFSSEAIVRAITLDDRYINEIAEIKKRNLSGTEKSNAQASAFGNLLKRNGFILSGPKFWKAFTKMKNKKSLL